MKSSKFKRTEMVDFLKTEYSECFDHMRHYEGVADSYLKFATGGYPVIIGGISALYTILSVDYRNIVVSALLFLTLLAGLAILNLLVTNRSYYVIVTRQVNAIRWFFLHNAEDVDFVTYNKAYTDSSQPHAYNPNSTSTRLFDIMSLLNALVGAGVLYFFLYHFNLNIVVLWVPSAVLLVVLVIFQKMWSKKILLDQDIRLGVQAGGNVKKAKA